MILRFQVRIYYTLHPLKFSSLVKLFRISRDSLSLVYSSSFIIFVRMVIVIYKLLITSIIGEVIVYVYTFIWRCSMGMVL